MTRATSRHREAWVLLWRWGPPLLWMAVISSLSTDAFSAKETGRFLIPILKWVIPGATPATLDWLHSCVRKGMHLVEFGILALLWYRTLGWHGPGWHTKTAVATFLLTFSLAALDEAHQIFVPSRTGSLSDVGWDSLGAALGLVIRRQGGHGLKNDAPPETVHPGARV